MKNRLVACFAAVALAFGLVPARAQYEPGTFMYFDHLANNTAVNLGINASRDFDSSEDDNNTPASAPVVSANLDFAVSDAVRRKTVNEVVDALGQLNPAQKDEFRNAFLNHDIFGQLEIEMAKENLRTSNLADAMTVYLINAWDAGHGVTEEASSAKVAAVRAQMASALGQNAVIAGLGDGDKQSLSDTLLINGMLIAAMNEATKTNPAIAPNVSRSALSGAAIFGFDLSKMRLTESGFDSAG